MKPASLLTAVAIVLVANAFTLIHAWKNRAGPVDSDITLTERELPLPYKSNKEDSGVAFDLRWMDPAWELPGWERPASWLDQTKLQELGFDTSGPLSDDRAAEFYQRQRARRAFVALEYDGPAWRKHLEQAERAEVSQSNVPVHLHESETHLVVIDASADASRLRARHPDRNSVMILPAVVRIVVEPSSDANRGRPSRPARLSGWVQEIPRSIHVPRPFSDAFQRLPEDRRNVKYRVHLRYGASLEPWVVGVEFPAPAIP
jgi:hypothetical protein